MSELVLKTAIAKIVEIAKRDGNPEDWAKNFQDLLSAIEEAALLLETADELVGH
jgi:hypothetical protein